MLGRGQRIAVDVWGERRIGRLSPPTSRIVSVSCSPWVMMINGIPGGSTEPVGLGSATTRLFHLDYFPSIRVNPLPPLRISYDAAPPRFLFPSLPGRFNLS